MGASRKLQGEIDRVLKKVQEGAGVFDSILDKLYKTDNANHKEKFEVDLYKEIKKLQRYRDQLKTWMQSSEIKDDKPLVDALKLIKQKTGQFRICTKETKTKAFSKEGLGQQPKTDPKEKAKSETRDWLNNVVDELENQINSFEAEVEGLSVKKRKIKLPKLTHLETSISRHKAHIMKLELILRLLDNDGLSPEEVNGVRDFLEDYVETNQEKFHNFSDVDELYNSLNLDEVESLENLVTFGPPRLAKTISTSIQQVASSEDQADETTFQNSNSDTVAKTPHSKSSVLGSAPQTTTANHTNFGAASISSLPESCPAKDDEIKNVPGGKSPPLVSETGSRTMSNSDLSSQPPSTIPFISGSEDRATSTVTTQSIPSPLSNRVIIPQTVKADCGRDSDDVGNAGDSAVMTSPFVTGMRWWPWNAFQNENEVGLFRGQAVIDPDQREKFLQRFQRMQLQGQSNIPSIPSLSRGQQYSTQPQNPLSTQFNDSQSSSIPLHLGLRIGVQNASSSSQQQPFEIHHRINQQTLISDTSREAETALLKVEESLQQQPQQPPTENSTADQASNFGLGKNPVQHDEIKAGVNAVSLAEPAQVVRDVNLYPGQPLQPNVSTETLGVIGQRSVSELGASGDNMTPTRNYGEMNDHLHNLQMLKGAFRRLPQSKDSERTKSYTPKHPAVTPPSYPQVITPIVNNPAFWDRLCSDAYGTDTLFFSFYYQQNTYQQYFAAKELKRRSWRYHRKYNTWFQRFGEPRVITDDFEQGAYMYFDFHFANDEQHGWCKRLKAQFCFEYKYLEDELN